VRTFGGISFAYDVAVDGEGAVWISGGQTARVTDIVAGTGGFPTTPTPAASFRVDGQAGAETIGGGDLWISNGAFTAGRAANAVSRVDLRSLSAIEPIRLENTPSAIAFGFGAVWLGTYDDPSSAASLTVIQPGSARPAVLRLAPNQAAGPLSIATGNGSVWVLTFTGMLIRVDPETRRVLARIKIGITGPPGPSSYEPLSVAVGAGAVWVTDRADDSIAQINPRTNTLIRTISLGSLEAVPCDIAATTHALWVTIASDSDCGSSSTR
jgi:streptogramin lyase